MSAGAGKVVAGMGWVALISYSNRLFGFVTTLILAKLLTPHDFGLVAVAAMLIEALRLFKDIGLSEALIYQKREDELAIRTANTILVGFNAVLFGLSLILAPLAARFYDDPLVTPLIVVMASNLLWDSMRAVPRALLRKNIEFHKLVIPEVVPVIVSSVVSVAMAITGFGVWSLVAKTVLHSVLGMVLLIPSSPVKLQFGFDRGAAGELFRYGRFVATTTVLLVVLYNIDRFYVSQVEGVVALGLFELAMRISDLPVKEFSFIIGSVMFPVFARAERSGQSLGPALLKTLRYIAFISMPMAIGVSVYGPPLVRNLYGQKWEGIALPLQILALYAMFRALSSIIYDVFKASGAPNLMQRFVLFKLGMIGVLGIPVLREFGLNGLCALILATYAVVLVWEMWQVTRLLDLPFARSLAVFVAPASLAASIVPGVFVLLGLHSSPAATWQLVAGALLTGVIYMAAIGVVDKQAVSDVRALAASAAA